MTIVQNKSVSCFLMIILFALYFIATDVNAGGKEYYSGMRYIEKKDCDSWGQIGIKQGIKDRVSGMGDISGKRKRRLMEQLIIEKKYHRQL